MLRRAIGITIALTIGCKGDKPAPPPSPNVKPTHGMPAIAAAGSATEPAEPPRDIDSKAILSRTEVAPDVYVKHILISWKDLASLYNAGQDPRGLERTNAEAARLAQEILGKLAAHPEQIDELMKQYSEDPASKDTGLAYEIRTETEYWPEFKQLALHLKQNEAGIVKTQWGYHVVERVAPPPPDPFESTEILARPAVPGLALVQQVMIGWKDAPGAQRLMNAPKRSKAEADQIARDVLERARAGEDFASLMKYTDELESMKLARTYEVNTADDPVPFAKLAVRMKVGEVGVVKSLFGWHIVKRIPPPPGDKLDSAAILKRDTVADKVKVKHIVLGWTDAHGKDPRGKTRDRSTLEKLVSTTLARLKKGESFESLMKELSEDPKSAATGESFEVTPTATTLLLPFRNLALRLHPGEVGVVKSQIGIHIVERVE